MNETVTTGFICLMVILGAITIGITLSFVALGIQYILTGAWVWQAHIGGGGGGRCCIYTNDSGCLLDRSYGDHQGNI